MLKSRNPPTLGARLNAVLGQLLLLGAPSAVDTTMGGHGTNITTGKGGHGTHKERGKAPADLRPLVEEWADFFRRAVELAEHDLAMERGHADRPTARGTGKVSKARQRERDRRIARSPLYVGRHPEFVAYLEGTTARKVQEVRRDAKLDPSTGERMPTGPRLTAPPCDQIASYDLGRVSAETP